MCNYTELGFIINSFFAGIFITSLEFAKYCPVSSFLSLSLFLFFSLSLFFFVTILGEHIRNKKLKKHF